MRETDSLAEELRDSGPLPYDSRQATSDDAELLEVHLHLAKLELQAPLGGEEVRALRLQQLVCSVQFLQKINTMPSH